MSMILALLLVAGQGAEVPDPEQERLRRIAESWDRPAFSFGGYALPASAATDRPLVRFLLRMMERDRRAAERAALENRAEHRRQGWYFNPHHLRFAWRTEGEASPLLSLSATVGFFAGQGGYDAHRAAALLWDRASDRPVALRRLLGRGMLAWERRYCAIKQAAGEWPLRDEDAYPVPATLSCPDVEAEVVAPTDRDGNGRFDSLRLFRLLGDQNSERTGADELPFRAEDLAHLPQRFRAAFEVPSRGEARLGVEVDPD